MLGRSALKPAESDAASTKPLARSAPLCTQCLMATYVGAERASSTDPRDWGRALAVALERLLEAARLDGRYAQHEHLCGVDLILRIEEDGDGAKVAVRWVPEEDGDADDGEKL